MENEMMRKMFPYWFDCRYDGINHVLALADCRAGLRRALMGGDGVKKFPRHVEQGGNRARKIHAGRGRRSHSSAPPRSLAIPTLDGIQKH